MNFLKKTQSFKRVKQEEDGMKYLVSWQIKCFKSTQNISKPETKQKYPVIP